MYENIAAQRFFRSKQAGINSLTQLQSTPVGDARWVLADIDGDLYQLVLSGDDDVLPDELVALRDAFLAEQAFGMGELEVLSRPVVPEDGSVKVSAAEQSNSSVIFSGESPAIAKIFRKLEPGINPDVELLSGLSRVGCSYVPALRAYSTIEWSGDTYVTAMVQDFAAGSREGWDLALQYATDMQPFAEEAGLIGTALSAVHRDLATAFGTEQVAAASLVEGLSDRLESLIAQAPVLRPFEPAIRELYARAATGTATVQRIHGDAHLGQILRTQDKYLLIDFEGEPARPLAERRQMFSPLQDLAGFIRSFGYAAHFGSNLADPEGWAADCAAAMLEAYGAQASPLLDALVLDKALYEVVYEANNRPDWLHIPLDAVRRLIGA
ncbi:hypothetical protein [Corynebacterium hindlerae]|uniref:hypothetical protein n=1 Tax=Corynebacterium hindlerae TaxID=699041 RepID=UPI0031B7027C